MIVLIDNYDSFSYNLYQLLGQFDPDITVIRNDEKTVQDIEAMHPDHLIISPGPGRPADAGVCEEAISYFAGKVPILGVCLGHQAICEVYGGTITYAKQLMHGKQSVATLKTDNPLFKGLPEQVDVGRYHSLALAPDTLPDVLEVLAQTEEGEIMAVGHKQYPIYGLQFHPESILTPQGPMMVENFLKL
ncbi:aminodeoxychorismate/anthranilate synthase component II [uncultured Megasphaera sp.]|uniref:anthranilate synthase component II n=1 Tax=uncultured Megasphaera sp. TaxID=165188 RepID=UPI00280583B1|nr:aminodeoxychorismate/anthranilate synthase component II [uncultured Megasphaera sp.]